MFPKASLVLCLLCGVVTAHAAPIFTDNFDAAPLGANLVPPGWSVLNGTVDVIGQGSIFDLLPGHGRYVDLDGTSSDAGVLVKSFALQAGVEYIASFDLAGNQKVGTTELVDVTFGNQTVTYSLAMLDPFARREIAFTPTVPNAFWGLQFANRGGDNVGALLDNVQVTSIPEPSTVWMLILGLAAFALRRRASPGAP